MTRVMSAFVPNKSTAIMNKGEFIEKRCPETSNSRMKEVNYKIVYDPEFQSDLNTLLTETAEKQKKACYEEAEKAYQLGNPFFRAIRNTPLVTQITEE